MTDSRTLAYVGATLLFMGVFLPIVTLPLVGQVSYVQNGRGDGVIVIILAAASALLAATGRTRHLLWTGGIALAMILYTLFQVRTGIAEARAAIDAELADSPFRGVAEAAMASVQLQWGWAVLLIAAGIVAFAGWSARREARGAA